MFGKLVGAVAAEKEDLVAASFHVDHVYEFALSSRSWVPKVVDNMFVRSHFHKFFEISSSLPVVSYK